MFIPKLAVQKKCGIRDESEARVLFSARFWPCKLKGMIVFTALISHSSKYFNVC